MTKSRSVGRAKKQDGPVWANIPCSEGSQLIWKEGVWELGGGCECQEMSQKKKIPSILWRVIKAGKGNCMIRYLFCFVSKEDNSTGGQQVSQGDYEKNRENKERR